MNDIIHPATNANFTGYTYNQVYASVAATPTINGVVVTIPVGNPIDIQVKTISATANVFLIGKKRISSPTIL